MKTQIYSNFFIYYCLFNVYVKSVNKFYLHDEIKNIIYFQDYKKENDLLLNFLLSFLFFNDHFIAI
jgi:hypothetical protein